VIDAIARDARLAARALTRTPGFAVAAVLTLAIGMGGTSLMLTAADAAFNQPLAFGRADAVVHVWQVSSRSNQVAIPLRVARDWEASVRAFERVGLALGAGSVNVSTGQDAERAINGLVSGSFFAVLGVTPTLGRSFSVEETRPNGPVAAVISDALWERLFARAADVLSRTILIEGVPYPIVGVMPAGFSYPLGSDLWTTFERDGPDAYGDRTSHNFEMIARLAPGATPARAQAELEQATRLLHDADSLMKQEGFTVRVSSFRDDVIGGGGNALKLLTAAVLCVLLIACVNVANLMLARSVSRESQSTLRVVLGATSGDLVRLFVIESVILAAAGAVVGALLVVWAAGIASGLLPSGLTLARGIAPDVRVIALCAGIMLVAALICAAPSAMHGSRLDLRSAISTSSRAVAREPRGMNVLTAIEVALACVLLVGAGLLLRSLGRLEVVDPGFRSENVLVSPFTLGAAPGSPYADARARARFLDGVLERVRQVPGVRSAGATSSLPFTFSPNALLEEDGVPLGQWGQAPVTHYRVIGGDVFQTLGVPLKAGRYFNEGDRLGTELVAIVNEATVRQLWSGASAIGRRVRMRNMDRVEQFATVVGVVADVRHRALTSPPLSEVFFPYA
jgi:predicted permease